MLRSRMKLLLRGQPQAISEALADHALPAHLDALPSSSTPLVEVSERRSRIMLLLGERHSLQLLQSGEVPTRHHPVSQPAQGHLDSRSSAAVGSTGMQRGSLLLARLATGDSHCPHLHCATAVHMQPHTSTSPASRLGGNYDTVVTAAYQRRSSGLPVGLSTATSGLAASPRSADYSRDAVLHSYSHPPQHVTSCLQSSGSCHGVMRSSLSSSSSCSNRRRKCVSFKEDLIDVPSGPHSYN